MNFFKILGIGFVGILAAFVVGGGVCTVGIVVSEMPKSAQANIFTIILQIIGIALVWGAIPLGIFAMIKVIKALRNTYDDEQLPPRKKIIIKKQENKRNE